MQSVAVEEPKTTAAEKIVKAPVEAGTVVIEAVDSVGNEVAKVIVKGAAVVVEATKAVVNDLANAGEMLSRETKQAVTPIKETLHAAVTPDPVAPKA